MIVTFLWRNAGLEQGPRGGLMLPNAQKSPAPQPLFQALYARGMIACKSL